MAHASHLPQLSRRSPVIGLIILMHAAAIYFINAGLRVELPPLPATIHWVSLAPEKHPRHVPVLPPPEPGKTVPEISQTEPELPPIQQDPPNLSRASPEPDPTPQASASASIPRTFPTTDPRRPITQPPYPTQAIRMEQEGLVVVNACVRPDGRLTGLRVVRSSGYPVLDSAALTHLALPDTRLLPGTENGRPVTMCTDVPIRFSIDRR